MPRHAFILGGTGQVGRAVAENLLDSDWYVTLAQRGLRTIPESLVGRGAKVVTLDRETPGELGKVLGTGADALIDVTAYNSGHARQLLDVQSGIGAFVVISSVSVYQDDKGRNLSEWGRDGFPEWPVPIPESQPTVPPGPTNYSTRKVALEQTLLNEANVPVTILRPAAIYGPGSIHPREWFFVKRILDGRKAILLANRGESRFHPSSTANIAELTRVSLGIKGTRILNIGDPTTPSVAAIATLIAKHMNYSGRIVELEGSEPSSTVGGSPWSGPHPLVLDNSAALALGYRPVTTYAQAVGETCDWLVAVTPGKDWRELFPDLATRAPYDLFDYALEDAFLRTLQ